MTVEELKNKILSEGRIDNIAYVFVWEDSKFLPLQYLKAIASKNELEIVYHETLEEFITSIDDSFSASDDVLHVFICDKLEVSKEDIEYMSKKSNFIVMCKKCTYELNELEVKFPKLVDWQIEDYVTTICQGLTKDRAKTLVKLCKSDPFASENEALKLSVFSNEAQSEAFDKMFESGAYGLDDSPFPLVNAIVKNDKASVGALLNAYLNTQSEAYALVSILRNNFKDVCSVQMDSSATSEKLGMNPKKFSAIRYSCNKFSNDKLIDAIEYLSSFDWQLKTGRLDLSRERQIDYVVCKIMS